MRVHRPRGYVRRPMELPELPDPFAALRDHVLAHAVKRGEFTLKSGARSSWFLDTKQTACRPDGIVLVADAALAVIPDEATAIGGLTMGADAVRLRRRRHRRDPWTDAAQLQRAQGGQGPRRHRPRSPACSSRATRW